VAASGGGGSAVTPDVTVEAPKPVGATPEQTAQADYGQLAQSGGIAPVEKTADPASSGVTVEGASPAAAEPSPAPAGDQAPARTAEGHGPDVTAESPPSAAGDAPGGASEGQGPGGHERPRPGS
jgi:hypothetical protein